MKKILMLFLLSIFLVACNQNRIDFTGEGDHWDVTYHVKTKGENSQSSNLEIRYTGDDTPPEDIHFELGDEHNGNVSLNEGTYKGSPMFWL